MTSEKNAGFLNSFSQKYQCKAIFNVSSTYKMFADHIKVIGGAHVARGQDVAQACHRVRHQATSRVSMKLSSSL